MPKQSVGKDPSTNHKRSFTSTTDSSWPMRSRSRHTEMVGCVPPTNSSEWMILEYFGPRRVFPRLRATPTYDLAALSMHGAACVLVSTLQRFSFPHPSAPRVHTALEDCIATGRKLVKDNHVYLNLGHIFGRTLLIEENACCLHCALSDSRPMLAESDRAVAKD